MNSPLHEAQDVGQVFLPLAGAAQPGEHSRGGAATGLHLELIWHREKNCFLKRKGNQMRGGCVYMGERKETEEN
jgi:hypothetical protein